MKITPWIREKAEKYPRIFQFLLWLWAIPAVWSLYLALLWNPYRDGSSASATILRGVELNHLLRTTFSSLIALGLLACGLITFYVKESIRGFFPFEGTKVATKYNLYKAWCHRFVIWNCTFLFLITVALPVAWLEFSFHWDLEARDLVRWFTRLQLLGVELLAYTLLLFLTVEKAVEDILSETGERLKSKV